MIEKIELKEYWFFNTLLPSQLPKKVKVIKIDRNVAFFNDWIANEKFADVRVVKNSLFNDYNKAMGKFVEIVSDPDEMNFVDPDVIEQAQIDYPEALL